MIRVCCIDHSAKRQKNKKGNARSLELAFPFLTGRTRCIRNAPALMHGLYSIRSSQLAHQTSGFLVICSVYYKQTQIRSYQDWKNTLSPITTPSRFEVCAYKK